MHIRLEQISFRADLLVMTCFPSTEFTIRHFDDIASRLLTHCQRCETCIDSIMLYFASSRVLSFMSAASHPAKHSTDLALYDD